MAGNGITARRNFYRIWIAGKKSLVKRAPAQPMIVMSIKVYKPRLVYIQPMAGIKPHTSAIYFFNHNAPVPF